MASFHERPGSRGLGKPASSDGGGANNVASGGHLSVTGRDEFEKLKLRVQEVEHILMAKELTMKNLGDGGDDSHKNSMGKKSSGKFDKDWTTKVEMKLSKLYSNLKNLTNKVSDLQYGSGSGGGGGGKNHHRRS